MKSFFYSLVFIFLLSVSVSSVYAQYWNITGNSNTTSSNFIGTTNSVPLYFRVGNTNRMIINTSGNVGIGTTAPTEKLNVSGNVLIPFGKAFCIGSTSESGTHLRLWHDSSWGGISVNNVLFFKATSILMGGSQPANSKVTIHHSEGSVNSASGSSDPLIIWAGWDTDYMKLSIGVDNTNKCSYIQSTRNYIDQSTLVLNAKGGSVTIGTIDPKGYKLAVAGKIVAEEVVVKLRSNWPDYVFDNNYNLMSLSETEKFIKENKHLPNVPSSKEIEENGIGLSEMNAILLEKIEELTLHIIELEKKINNK